jgi:hypothetical protein
LLLLLAQPGPGTRLQTRSISQNQSHYKGGYDMRAAAFENMDHSAISLWVVNRAPVAISFNLDLPAAAKVAGLPKGNSLVCPMIDGRCNGGQFKLFPISAAQVTRTVSGTQVNLPARSVTTLSFDIQK